jgi:hypothetical protein
MGIAFSNVYVDYYLLNQAMKKRKEEDLHKKNDTKIKIKKNEVNKKKCYKCFG